MTDLFEANPRYAPEKCGLTFVDSLEDPGACYSFDDIVLWRAADGTLYWGADSGCSCPTPFEDVRSLADLSKLPDSARGLAQAVERHPAYDTDKQVFLRHAGVRPDGTPEVR